MTGGPWLWPWGSRLAAGINSATYEEMGHPNETVRVEIVARDTRVRLPSLTFTLALLGSLRWLRFRRFARGLDGLTNQVRDGGAHDVGA